MSLTQKPDYVCPECWECAEAWSEDPREILNEYVDQLREGCRDQEALIAAGLRFP